MELASYNCSHFLARARGRDGEAARSNVRSAWRRVKKDIKDAIIRDLKPVKDVKGGGGFEGKSKSTKGGTGATGSH